MVTKLNTLFDSYDDEAKARAAKAEIIRACDCLETVARTQDYNYHLVTVFTSVVVGHRERESRCDGEVDGSRVQNRRVNQQPCR